MKTDAQEFVLTPRWHPAGIRLCEAVERRSAALLRGWGARSEVARSQSSWLVGPWAKRQPGIGWFLGSWAPQSPLEGPWKG